MRIFASNLNDRPHFTFWCKPHPERPVYYDLAECIEAIRRYALTSSAVTFPGFNARLMRPGELNAYIEYSNVDLAQEDTLVEWRCYRNGEFRYRANFWELSDPDTQWRMRQKTIFVAQPQDPECAGFINLVTFAYRVAAAHAFAERLLRAFASTIGAVTVGLDGIAGYGIGRVDESQHFARLPIALDNDCTFHFSKEKEEVAKRVFDPYEISALALQSLYRSFGWETNVKMFDEWIGDVRELVQRG